MARGTLGAQLFTCRAFCRTIGGLPREYHNAGADGVKRFIEELTPTCR